MLFVPQRERERESKRARERFYLCDCRYFKYNAIILVLYWEMCVKRQSLLSEMDFFVALNNLFRIIFTRTVNQEDNIGIGSHV
jgi:hypothetical protein